MSSTDEDSSVGKNRRDVKTSEDASADNLLNKGEAAETEEESNSRMNAAKAFFRAMYAGDEVDAEQYGMNVGTVKAMNEKGVCSSCDNLAAQVEQLEARSNELEGLYKRMAADFENYRKRIEREKDELATMGVQKAVEAILPALDDLDRAQITFNQSSELSHVIESIKLIADRFSKCLEQVGVKQLNTVGKAFDPRLHEPVQQVPAPHLPEGAVADDLRRGYSMGERVIRPALVNVVSNEMNANNNNEELAEQEDAQAQDS